MTRQSPKVHRDPPTRPPRLIDDGYIVDPEKVDPRLPYHGWESARDRWARSAERPVSTRVAWLIVATCVGVILAVLVLLLAAPRTAADVIPADSEPSRNLRPQLGAPQPVGVVPTGLPAGAPSPTGAIGTAFMGGWISWAEPELGGDYLATRFPRGTLVRICAVECLVRVTTDFGPSAAIDPPRIADLAVLDWEFLCRLPRERGVCRGTVETIAPVKLPATDAVK